MMNLTYRQIGAVLRYGRTMTSVVIGATLLSCSSDGARIPTSPPVPVSPPDTALPAPIPASGQRVATSALFVNEPSETVASGTSLGNVRVVLVTKPGEVAAGARYFVVLSLSASDTSAHLGGTTTVETNTGFASFPDLVVDRAGADYRLVAHVYGVDSAVSQRFTVVPGTPAKLRFRSFDNFHNAGTELNAVVEVTDAAGNIAPNATNTVSLGYTYRGSSTFASAADSIFGPTTANAVNGVARFSGFSFHKKGAYTLEATSPGLAPAATSNLLTVFAGDMAKLVFVTQPSDGTPNAPLPAFSVFPTDIYGNSRNTPSTLLKYTVTVSLGNNPSGAAVSGTTTVVESVNVPMFFRDVRVDKPGTGYTLVAKTSGPVDWRAESLPFSLR